MSQENVEIVRRANALLNAGDWESMFALYHPEAELRGLQHAPDVTEMTHGLEGARALIGQWIEALDQLGAEVYAYLDVEPWVVCDTRWYGKGKGSEVPIELRAVDAYVVEDGRVVRAVLGYADVDTALADLGLAE
jgi:ketosteroid isomerase-like protein